MTTVIVNHAITTRIDCVFLIRVFAHEVLLRRLFGFNLGDFKGIASVTYRYYHKDTLRCVEVKFKTFTVVSYPRNTKDLDIKLSSCNSARV